MYKSLSAGFLFLTAGLSMAQVTTTPNVIDGCVGNLTGIFREVPNANYCLKGLETFQEFNITGPVGPTGSQGIQGVAGPIGPQGPVGPQGVAGVAGAKGATGSTGAAGATGAVGSQGVAGPQGIAGPTGANGAQGIAGPAGAQGPIGLTGAAGSTGAQGPIGLTGAAGSTGAQGPVGLTGAAGATGAQGPVGVAGSAGAKGATGATGPQGPQGTQGNTGTAGLNGQQGIMGATGPQGPAGTGSALQYYIYFYYQTDNLPGVGSGGSFLGNTEYNVYSLSCPTGETAVAMSCGYQQESNTSDQLNVAIQYVGLDVDNPGTSGLCSVSNTSANSRNIQLGISCLTTSSVPFGSGPAVTQPVAQAAKSCSYNPDTQAPCTAADATVPVKGVPQALAQTVKTSAAVSSQSTSTRKVNKQTTLWFK